MLLKSIIFCAAAATLSTAVMTPATQAQDSPWQIRGRLIALTPEESSTISVIGGEAKLGNDFVAEVDISYFFSKHIAAELILATTRHSVDAQGTVAGDIPVGKVSVLPPTLLAQYHFSPDAAIRPYIGAGINYTFFYNEKAEGSIVRRTDYNDSFGFALQAGVDIAAGKDSNWFYNIDVKKIWLKTDVELNTAVGPLRADVKINPWIFGAGIGYRF